PFFGEVGWQSSPSEFELWGSHYCESSFRFNSQSAILPKVFHLQPNSVGCTLMTSPSGFDIRATGTLRNSPPPCFLETYLGRHFFMGKSASSCDMNFLRMMLRMV